MTDECIRREDAKDALQEKVFHNLTDEFYGAMQVLDELEPADVINKADMLTLLEETEKDITKGVEASPTGMMIRSVFGVIKCKVNMMGEKTDG